MATETPGNYITREAGADLSAKQYHIAKLTSNQAVLATAATDEIVGVLDEVPQKSTGPVSIAHVSGNGTGRVSASAAISVGARLTATTDGQAVTAVQTTAGQQPTVRVFGRALEAATAQNDVIEYEKCNYLY